MRLTDAYKNQHDAIREEFSKQAEAWGRDEIGADLQWVVERLRLSRHLHVLDVAAGSGLLGRAIAPHVRSVVAVDITPEMLEQGRRRARGAGIKNIAFEEGAAEALAYPAESFDLVVTRFSVHHFAHPEVVVREMARVCRPAGRVAVIDIVSPEDRELASRHNQLERLRDPSHTRALAPSELRSLIEACGLSITGDDFRDVANDLDQWFQRAQTPDSDREEILERLREDLAGGKPTGMRPLRSGERLSFRHTWEVLVGAKP